VNRVTLIGIAGLVVLAAAIALNYWNGREPGEEPVVPEPTKASTPAEDTSSGEASAPAAPQEPTSAETPSEVAESSATQESAADAEGEDDGTPSDNDPGTTDTLSGQGTVSAQPATAGDDEAPAAGPTTPSEPSAAASPAPADEPTASSPTSTTDETLAADIPNDDATQETATAALDASVQVATQAPVPGTESAPSSQEPSAAEEEPVVAEEEPAAADEEPAPAEATPAEAQAAAVDATANAEAPGITVSPEGVAVAPVAPSFDVVRVNPRGDAVLAGRAEPDAEVIIHDDGEEIGRVMADSRGEWVFVPTEPLAPGNRELSLSARRGEEPEVLSDDTVVLVVPEPGKDVAGEVTGGAPTGTLALQIPRVSGAAEAEEAPIPTRVLQTPSGEEPAPEELALRAVDYGGGGQLVLSGNAPSGARLQVYLDDSLIGIAEVEDGGAWQLVPEGAVEAGVYTMRVDQVDEAGKVISRIELPFARAEPVVALPEETIVVVQPGNNLWQIARRTYGAGIKYTVIYDSNRDQIRDPHLIYPGQIFTLERIN